MSLPRLYKTVGVIIKRRNSGEADKSLSIFTKDFGKLRILAKGIRKITSRRSGHLDLFNHVAVTIYRGKSSDLIQEASRISSSDSFQLASTLPQTMYSFYLCEIIDKLTPDGQRHEDIYFELVHALQKLRLCTTYSQCKVIVDDFTLRVLRTLGYLRDTTVLTNSAIINYIEQIIEKKLRTPRLLTDFRNEE